jgi:hypothetical protein
MTRQTKKKQAHKKETGLNIDILKRENNKIAIKELRDLCHKFHENMGTLYTMLLLPYVLCTDEFLGHNEILLTLEAKR